MISDDFDGDIGDSEFIKSIFEHKCELTQNINSSKDNYVLHIAPKGGRNNGNIAVAYSKGYIDIFKLSNEVIKNTDTLIVPENIIDIDFSKENKDLLFIAKMNGKIDVYDLRCNITVQQFSDTTSNTNNFRNLTCLALSPSSTLISAGTELYEGDAFILFWDSRKTTFLGGYWQSHKDDITQVKFHSNDPNKLASGSTDGLINIYDISHSNEDEALIDTFNTESSVESIMWCKEKNKDHICCATHTCEIQLWSTNTGNLTKSFSRKKLSLSIQRKSEAHCYVASVYRNFLDQVFILVGSNFEKDKCMRTLKVSGNELEPIYLLPKNEQIIRCSWNDAKVYPCNNIKVTSN
ncbi:WD repeat-containing protein 89 isoform X1 [Agrilus planipennis]|uniref:WD repeat-containing protein 89 n=1 Tax=Agrilus planipennis TaxID=224129 RepID=A0A7F5RAH3_AGRPL|nr:WD repeat-containing protein 89 isoform X1 [Agrilus planipennis]